MDEALLNLFKIFILVLLSAPRAASSFSFSVQAPTNMATSKLSGFGVRCFLYTGSTRRSKPAARIFLSSSSSSSYSSNDSNDRTHDPDSETGDSSSFQKTYGLTGYTTPNNPSSVSISFASGHSLLTDVPKSMGGKDMAAQPVEHLLTAWAGCTQATALFVSRQMALMESAGKRKRLRLQKLEFIDILATRDERGALALPISEDPEIHSRLQSVSGTIRVYASSPLLPEYIEQLKHQTELRCPVANMMIASGCEMNVNWVDANA